MKKIAALVLVTLIAVLAIMPVALADNKVDPELKQPEGFQGFYIAEVEEAEVAETVVAPKTADAAPVALLVSLMAVSAAAFVACKH